MQKHKGGGTCAGEDAQGQRDELTGDETGKCCLQPAVQDFTLGVLEAVKPVTGFS